MNEYIGSLKIKLIGAVDLNQKKIKNVSDIKEAIKELESFPMTLDILNSSRIGKILNDIRHFNDAQSDIKTRLKNLIKQWNQLLPHHKKPNKIPNPLNSNGCNKSIKVSESSNNISHYNNENHKEKHLMTKSHRSSNNFEFINGTKKNIKQDCDNSIEIPNKKLKMEKLQYSDSPNNHCLKEIHLDSDSCPPHYKSNNLNNFSHKHDSPASLHFSDIHRFIKKEEDNQNNFSPLNSKERHRKRKHDLITNGITATPLQKVKSTRELLAEMGDLVGSDTKKKILCNEIAFEEDIPKSCIPESVRPKPKPIKQSKPAQIIDSIHKTVKYSPQIENSFVDYSSTSRSFINDSSHEPLKPDRPFLYGSLKENKISTPVKTSPFNAQLNTDSPLVKEFISASPLIENHAQSISISTPSDDFDKCSLKIKIPLKPYKKKSKHHDPPITNRMDDWPSLPDISELSLSPQSIPEDIGSRDKQPMECTMEIVDMFAHNDWEGYNCTRHPITGELLSFTEHYVAGHLHVLAWTDKVNQCNSFFPLDTDLELQWVQSLISDYHVN